MISSLLILTLVTQAFFSLAWREHYLITPFIEPAFIDFFNIDSQFSYSLLPSLSFISFLLLPVD